MLSAVLQEIWVQSVAGPRGEQIIVAKVPKGTALKGWIVRRIINALRMKLPLEQMSLEIVLMEDELVERPALTGSSADAVTFVQEILPKLAARRWRMMKVDW